MVQFLLAGCGSSHDGKKDGEGQGPALLYESDRLNFSHETHRKCMNLYHHTSLAALPVAAVGDEGNRIADGIGVDASSEL